jgi:hypothetical protein
MIAEDLDIRIRVNARRLRGGLKRSLRTVAAIAVSKGHKLNKFTLSRMLAGKATCRGKIEAIAAGLDVDLLILAQDVSPADLAADVAMRSPADVTPPRG